MMGRWFNGISMENSDKTFPKNIFSICICCIDNKEQDDRIGVSGEHNTKHGRDRDDNGRNGKASAEQIE